MNLVVSLKQEDSFWNKNGWVYFLLWVNMPSNKYLLFVCKIIIEWTVTLGQINFFFLKNVNLQTKRKEKLAHFDFISNMFTPIVIPWRWPDLVYARTPTETQNNIFRFKFPNLNLWMLGFVKSGRIWYKFVDHALITI